MKDPQSRPRRGMWQCFHCEAMNDADAEHCWKCTDAADAEVTRRLVRCYSIVDSLQQL